MEENLSSNNLLNNLEESGRRSSDRWPMRFGTFRERFFSRDIEAENEMRTERFSNEIYAYCLLVFVIFIVLGLNFIPFTETINQVGESVIFSTYYTSKYNLCLTYNNKNNAVSMGDMENTEKECIDGDVDITLFYKDVSLEGYYRVYAVFSFQLDYQGDWYVPWKKKHFFSSKNKNKRLVIGLSNLIQQESMFKPMNLNEVGEAIVIAASNNSKVDSSKNDKNSNSKDASLGDKGTADIANASSDNNEVGDNNINDIDDTITSITIGANGTATPINSNKSITSIAMNSKSPPRVKKDSTGGSDGTSGLTLVDSESNEDYADMLKNELEDLIGKELAEEVESKINEDIMSAAGTSSDAYIVFTTGIDNEVNGSSGVTLYLNSFVPNFINLKNVSSKLFKGVIKGDSNYNIYNEGDSLLNSIRLNTWNEFSNQFNVYNYNLQVNLSTNPLEYYYANQMRSNETRSDASKNGSEKMKNKISSFRRLDDFYLLNLRKFVQNEYQHMSNYDSSLLNIFNIFTTKNPYRHLFKTKSVETVKMTKQMSTEANKSLPEIEDGITDQEVLNKYFSPIDWNKASEVGSSGSGVRSKGGTDGTGTTGSGGNNGNSSVSGSGNVDIDGKMWCNDINIDLTFKGKEKNFKTLRSSIRTFSILFLAKSLSEIGLIWRQFSVVESAGQGRTVSLVSLSLLSFQDVLDLFLLLYHSSTFLGVAFVFVLMLVSKFIIICVLYQNFIVLVWRASHSRYIRRGWVQTQKSFLRFYKYYFTFMGILVLILYFFYDMFPFIIAISFWSWIPQILLDVWRGHNNSLGIMFIFFSIVLKMFFPIYLFFTPTNMFNIDKFSSDYLGHNRKLVYLITFIVSLQLILISAQRLKGPRCFAGWSILPKIYSYVRPWSNIMQDDDQECVICMYDIIQTNTDWCLTPCDHLFHKRCLKDWTTIKLECPNCRRPIPPITE